VVAGGGVGFGTSALNAPLYNVVQMAYNGTDIVLAMGTFSGIGPTMIGSRIVRITEDGILLPLAGNGLGGCPFGDGGLAVATSCALWVPFGLAINSATGDIFVSSMYSHSVRVVRGATGIITSYMGSGPGFRDGPSPQFISPGRMQWDSYHNALIICDTSNLRIRVWNGSHGFTWAGIGSSLMGQDPSLANSATLSCSSIALTVGADGGGAAIMDPSNHRIRFLSLNNTINFNSEGLSSTSVVTTIAGSGSAGKSFCAAPPASNIVLSLHASGTQAPGSEIVLFGGQNLSDGLLIIADSGNRVIRALNCSLGLDRCNSTVIVGTGISTYNGEGLTGLKTNVYSPKTLAVMPEMTGFLYFDESQQRLRKVQGGIVTTIGGGQSIPFDGAPLNVTFSMSSDSVLASAGAEALVIADDRYNCVRIINFSSNTVRTVAGACGSSNSGFSGDSGPATAARLNRPAGIAYLPDGSTHLSDTANNRVRGITPGGLIWTLAGNGSLIGGSDSCTNLTRCGLNTPTALWGGFNGSGTLLLFTEKHRVRAIALDNPYATPAQQQPFLRAITIAGNGTAGNYNLNNTDEFAVNVLLDTPVAVVGFNAQLPESKVYAQGPGFYIFVIDQGNKALRLILPNGTMRIILGAGVATSLLNPSSIAVSSEDSALVMPTCPP